VDRVLAEGVGDEIGRDVSDSVDAVATAPVGAMREQLAYDWAAVATAGSAVSRSWQVPWKRPVPLQPVKLGSAGIGGAGTGWNPGGAPHATTDGGPSPASLNAVTLKHRGALPTST
jgi:hypothetical protein